MNCLFRMLTLLIYCFQDSVDYDILIKLYKIYYEHRDAILWFLEQLDVSNYEEYKQKYIGLSIEISYFVAVCGFFGLSGSIVNNRMTDPDIYLHVQSYAILE